MQNLDGIFQSQSQTTRNTQTVMPPKEAVHQSNALQQMAAGSVFEGVITELKGNQVTIGLNNGQTLYAQLEQGIHLSLGEPIMFEVKSNNGAQIAIRPVEVAGIQNPTLSNALKAAGLPVTEQNISLVDAMMKQQMSIDKSSIQQMGRIVSSYKQADIETLVQMKKLDFTINEDTIEQFDNYKNDRHSLLEQFNGIMDSVSDLPKAFGSDTGQMLEFQKNLLDIFQELPLDAGEKQAITQSDDKTDNVVPKSINEALNPEKNSLGETIETNHSTSLPDRNEILASNEIILESEFNPKQQPLTSESASKQQPLASAFTPKQQETFELLLRQFPGMEENTTVFQDGKLNMSATPAEMLQAIQDTLQNGAGYTGEALQKLFTGKEYKNLMKQVMEQQWLVEPDKVASKESMEKLYERVNRQIERLEVLLQNTGKETAANKNVSNVRSNLEFMNQVNQLYNYIQIPLKFYNQNAHSDLYVYTNKKKLQDKDGELSALLHLDMEHLGPSDIHIKMVKSNVTASFYLSDELSVKLIREHMGELQEKLEEKGYLCSIHLENRQKNIDFVEDFLENEKPLGKIQRYSFDVMA